MTPDPRSSGRAAGGAVPQFADGRRFARRLLEPFGRREERLRLCLDAIERHHQLRSQWTYGAEVELLRRADLVDAFPIVFRFGLSRAWLADLFRRVPRRGLYSTILSGVGAMLRDRPTAVPRIFMPPRGASAEGSNDRGKADMAMEPTGVSVATSRGLPHGCGSSPRLCRT